jgi:F0F1-type ATP synthase membrane subunit c/vacuolar-type H+-ATPase subunit K
VISLSGLAVFFLGIALLIFVFFAAHTVFTDPDRLGPFANLIPDSEAEYDSAMKALGYAVAIGLLFVMGSVAGRIAKHGIEMYKARPTAEPEMQQRSESEARPSIEHEKES